MARISDAVAIRIDQDDDRVAGRIRLGIAILRPLPDEEAAARVERHRAGIAHQRLPGKELHLQLRRDLGESGVSGGLAERDGRRHGGQERQPGESRDDGVLHDRCLIGSKSESVSGGPWHARDVYETSDLRVVSGAHQIATMPRP